MKNILRNKKGFTLLEILVTVGIVGVLSAIAVPAYNQYKATADDVAIKSDVGNLHKAYLANDAVNNTFCESLIGVNMGSLGTSPIYAKAQSFYVGSKPNSACTGMSATDTERENGLGSSAASCIITPTSFKVGAVFRKGSKAAGYFIGDSDSAPTATLIAGTCEKKDPSGSATCAHTTSTPCNGDSDCTWNATGVVDVCAG